MPNTDSIKPKTVGWENINWQKVDRYVFKLQKRIYAASRRGEVKEVRKLQKTLMNSWSCKALAVRRVTQDNRGKKTAGVDGIKSLSPVARMKLIGQLKLSGKSNPTRRVWIPKPGRDEKRPLGIPTMHDRALQGVVKAALEPEWEAQFEAVSFGFRPGRACQDAIWTIKNAIQSKAKYVLDADIAKCFDRISHKTLLRKLNLRGKVRQQIKAWLKSGVIDQKVFTAISEGTPQGGICSPLLANIALLYDKYFIKIGRRKWIFATRKEDANPLRLLYHSDFESSSTNYVKVKSDKSPFDGNLIYWSTRMGRNPEMPTSKAIRLNKQRGKCDWCKLHFREGDILEEDHIIPTALGGRNVYENLQLLHGHCHDEKTALDLFEIRKKQASIFFKKLIYEWSKVDYLWIDDIPVVTSS